MSAPTLRFKDDAEREFPVWETRVLEEHTENICSGKSKDRSDSGEYVLYGSTGSIGLSKNFEYQGKAILIARVGANAGYLYAADGKYCVSDNTLMLTLKAPNNYSFFQNLLTKNNLNKLVFGSGQPLITAGQLKKLALAIPTVNEQTKIANFLNAVDEKISHLTRKHDLLTQYKKGVMQQIFSQELLFKDDDGRDFPEWEETCIGKVLTIGSGKDYKHLSSGEIPVYGTGGYMLSVNKYLYDGESVCIGRKGTIDKPTLLSGKFWTVDTLFYTHSFKKCLPKFIYAYFQTIDWKNYNEASGVPSLSKSTIEKIEIKIPVVAEQTQIAALLTAIDDKISSTQSKLTAAKQYKQGLLQQLFV